MEAVREEMASTLVTGSILVMRTTSEDSRGAPSRNQSTSIGGSPAETKQVCLTPSPSARSVRNVKGSIFGAAKIRARLEGCGHTLDLDEAMDDGCAGLVIRPAAIVAHVPALQSGNSED